jgi:hypothetical protein
MPFNSLILSCLLSRDTSFKDIGTGREIKIKPDSDETILFFIIDSESNKSSTFRVDLSIKGEICDLLILYSAKDSNEKIICLTELKGKDIKHATEQVKNTFNAMINNLDKEHLKRIKWKCYIHMNRCSSPQDLKKLRSQLDKLLGAPNAAKYSEDSNIGDFLRK